MGSYNANLISFSEDQSIKLSRNMDAILNEYISSKRCHASGVAFTLMRGNYNPRITKSYKGSLGFTSTQPFLDNSFIYLGSISKLVTVVAVLIAVEMGILSLEDYAGSYIPQLAEPEILLGYEDANGAIGRPITRKAKNRITIRHLLTHTSGLAYSHTTQDLKGWAEYYGREYGGFPTSLKDCLYPLLFEPGTDWEYGPGIDWAGRIVELVAQCSLEDFCKTRIWDLIGAHDTTFLPSTRPDLLSNRLEITHVTRKNFILKADASSLTPKDILGGLGLWSTPRDFDLFLWHLFFRPGGLVKSENLDLILTPQVSNSNLVTKKIHLSNQGVLTKTFPARFPLNVGFGTSIALRDIPGRRPTGSVSAAGVTNIHWWFDPKNHICGVLYMQLMHVGLSEANNLLVDLETAVYREVGKQQGTDGLNSKL